MPPEDPPRAAGEAAAGGEPSPIAGRRAEDRPEVAEPPARRPRRKTSENAVGAFLLAILVGAGIVWSENSRCPGALRAAFLAAAPLAVPIGVILAGLLANADKTATRQDRIGRGIGLAMWASVASVTLLTGVLLVMNGRGEREVTTRQCLIARRETVPARTAGVGEWVLVLRCSETMSDVRVDVDRRTWWDREAGETVPATVASGRLGFDWVVDTELGPPMRGFTTW